MVPGCCNSLPVEIIDTMGLLITGRCARPNEAATPICAGFINVPLLSTSEPLKISSPFLRIFSKCEILDLINILFISFPFSLLSNSSVSSKGTTAFAHLG